MSILELENPITKSQLPESGVKSRVRGTPVCIIIPPSPFLAEERVFPLLGPLKVAAELERNGNPVEVLDLSGTRNYKEITEQYALGSSIRNFGITATTPQFPAAVKVSEALKTVLPNSNVFLGGAHTTLTHSSFKANTSGRGAQDFQRIQATADKIVIGDGEKAVFYALDPDYQGKIIDAGDRNSPLFLQRGELEQYPWPARHLIDLDSYHYYIDGKRATSMIIQLGCPFECGFCSGRSTDFLRVTRTRGMENAISEMAYIYNTYGYRGFMFYDDELNATKGTLEDLCHGVMDLQERLGVDFSLRGFVKSELLVRNPEQATLMYKAGFREILTGIEAGSDRILDVIRKRTTPEINSQCREIAAQHGLKFKALMSLGHPGENLETVNESVNWVLANRPDDVDWTIITPYPGSFYFDRSVWDKDRKAWVYNTYYTRGNLKGSPARLWSETVDYSLESDYYKGVPGEYQAHIWTDALSKTELVTARDYAERVTRGKLGLPTVTKVEPAVLYEHSMGQGPITWSRSILNSSANTRNI